MKKSVFILLCMLCCSSIANAWSWVSPYAYCVGNMVNCIDPDGRDVLIWYKDKKGEYRSFRYNGTQKMVPNNSFVLDFVHTYNYLKGNNVWENIVNAVKNHSVLIEVQKSEIKTEYQNSDRRNTVFWEPRKGILLSNGKKQSPAIRLEHEFDHCMDDLKNHKDHEDRKDILDNQFDNKEERRVITGSETKTAKKLHQGVRTNHAGKIYQVKDPRFTK